MLPSSTLGYPTSIAVDGAGNVYIADTGNARVLIEIPSVGGFVESQVPNSATSPSQVALDGSGNVYIVDNGSNRILLETLRSGGYTESQLPFSTSNSIQSIAVDGNGNVYVIASSSVAVLIANSGTYIEKTIPTSSLVSPYDLAVDGSGNVYVTDSSRDVVLREDLADAPALNFASTQVGSTSTDSPQTIAVENLGNGTLTFPVPANGGNPSVPPNFTSNPNQPISCQFLTAGSSTAATLPAGQMCFMSISFTPTAAGTFSSPLVLTDTEHNAAAPAYATQSILLNGTGTQGTLTNQTITFPAIANQSFGGYCCTARDGQLGPAGQLYLRDSNCLHDLRRDHFTGYNRQLHHRG